MKVIASKPLFKDFNKLAISPPSKNKTKRQLSRFNDLFVVLTGHTFDVDVWRCECRLCDSVGVYGGGSLSPRPVLCYWGPYQWGSVHRFKGPPSPRDQFILILGAQVCNNLIKGQQLFQATDMIGSLKMDQHHILVNWVILTQFFPYYANLKIFFRDFWGNSCLRFNKDIKFHPYKKHHLLRQQLKKKKLTIKQRTLVHPSYWTV